MMPHKNVISRPLQQHKQRRARRHGKMRGAIMFALIFLCYFLCIKTKKVNRDYEHQQLNDAAQKNTNNHPLQQHK